MATFLQPDVLIETAQGWPVLSREGVRVKHRLQVAEAVVLTFLGASGDPTHVAELCSQCLPNQDGMKWVAQVLDRYWSYLGDGQSRPADLGWLEALDPTDIPRFDSTHKQAAPSSIVWLVTLACNRRCPYCFYNVTHYAADQLESPADASFPLQDALRMIEEMAQIGASDLYLTGGEPLLRKDLPEIIAAATSFRVRTHLVTKYPITTKLAQRLAQAELTQVTFSLDDARAREAGILAGARGFLDEAKTSIAALLEAQIPLEVNAVATALNIDHLEGLVQQAITLKVPKLTVSSYTLPHMPKAAAVRLVPANTNLADRLSKLRQQYGGQIVLELGTSSAGLEWQPCSEQVVCDVGLRELHVLPDGRVTRCRYLPGHEELIVGSLQTDTLLDIWEGKRLNDLSNPHPDMYGNTNCNGCSSFQACNTRGRCYYTALTRSNELYAPDNFCNELWPS